MKTKKLLRVLIALWGVLVLAFVGVVAAGCKKDPDVVDGDDPNIDDGSGNATTITESAEYYYDYSDSVEYRLTLENGAFTFTTTAELSGTYTRDESETVYTFTFTDGSTMEGALGENIMTVTYNGSEMRFWKDVEFTVSFETNGGSALSSVNVRNGKTLARPSDPVRDGYGLISWYADAELSSAYAFGSAVVTADMTLYARWGVKADEEFVISFDLNYSGAEELESQTTIGAKVYADNVETPSRSGYTFLGWWVSMYADAEKLAYEWTEDMEFAESMTLYALWVSDTADSSCLQSPVVTVSESGVSWTGVTGASSYTVTITGPDGETTSIPIGGTVYSYEFTEKEEGDYVVTVTAESSDSSVSSSEACVRYYKNKALARVSLFSVEDNILIFNAVANAEEYYITIVCGNADHHHEMMSLGTATSYDFSNCIMTGEGITFIITAAADGYASSQSAAYVVLRSLDSVTFTFDDSTETLAWAAVENAAEYTVVITSDEGETTVTTNETSVSLKNYSGTITVSVTAKGSGYNASETAYTYNKTRLAAPSGITIVGTVMSWNAVSGATGYTVKIGTETYTTATNSFDLSTAAGITWMQAADYAASVQANGTQDSLWSDEVDMRYYALYSGLAYADGTVTWRYVVGAEKYEVIVNKDETYTGDSVYVTDGSNYAKVTLTAAGTNIISVRYYADGEWSEWASMEVFAYTVTFDSRSGEGVAAVYAAAGDTVVLPETTRTGYTFAEWYNAPGGGATNAGLYEDGSVTVTGDITVYAYWIANTYTVTLMYEDGTTATVTVTYDDTYQWDAPMSQNSDTYGFVGWYTQEDGKGSQLTDETGASTSVWQIAEDTTVYTYFATVLSFTVSSSGDVTVSKGDAISTVTVVTVPATYTDDDGVTRNVTVIGSASFTSCTKLVELNIPNTITSITASTFRTCTALQAINVYDAAEEYGIQVTEPVYWSEDGVLMYENSLTASLGYGVELEFYPRAKTDTTYTIPDGVQAIAYDAFYYATFAELIIPASVNFLYANALYYCKSLTAITFLEGTDDEKTYSLELTTKSFYYCTALETVTFPSHLSTFTITATLNSSTGLVSSLATPFYSCSALAAINVTDSQTGTNAAFASVDGKLTDAAKQTILYAPVNGVSGSYTIPTGIYSINDYAFYSCTGLTELVVPNHVENIGAYAFASCTNLVTLTIVGSLAGLAIGDYAFKSCTKLTTVNMEGEGYASGVTFGEGVFYLCSTLTTVNIGSDVEYFSGSVFSGCTSLESITISASNTNFVTVDGVLYDAAMTEIMFFPYGKTGSYVVPDTVTAISEYQFYYRTGLTEITIPASITEIPLYAFYHCEGLTKVTFKEGSKLETIGAYAFAYCTALTSIELPSSLVTIDGGYAFAYSGLASITLPSSLKTISQYTFSNCTSLREISIPNSVTYIGIYAFTTCTALRTVVFEEGGTEELVFGATVSTSYTHSRTFTGCSSLRSVTLCSRIKSLYAYMFYNNAITEIVIPNSVTYIDVAVFNNCTALTTVTFEGGGTEELTIRDPSTTTYRLFSGCTALETVTLPARLTKIPDYCFYSCTALTTVTVESGESKTTEIGASAFYKAAALTTLVMPSAVATIGENAFSGCTGLISVTLSDALPASFDYATLFDGCLALEEILVSDSAENFASQNGILYNRNKTEILYIPANLSATVIVIPYGVTELAADAFNGYTSITSITFESGSVLSSIGANAFSYTSITSLVLPSVTTVDTTAFDYCNLLESITLSGSFPMGSGLYVYFQNCPALKEILLSGVDGYTSVNGVVYSSDTATLVYYPVGKTDTSYTAPSSVTAISSGAFAGNDYLASVDLSAVKLTEIASYTFVNCSALTSVTLASGLTSIGYAAFYGCSSLASLNLPDTVTEIGYAAFYQSGLKAVTLSASVTSIGAYAFGYCADLVTADLSKVQITAFGEDDNGYAYTFLNCTALKSVTLPEKLTLVGAYMFYGCAAMESIALPDTVTEIGYGAFYKSGLTSVTLSSSITSIGAQAFGYCADLVTADLSKVPITAFGVSNSTAYTFQHCTSLKSILLPETLTVVGAYMFSNCTALETISIPDTVTRIGSAAFYKSGLTSITLSSSITTLGSWAFAYCYDLETADLSKTQITKFNLVSSGTYEGNSYAFYYCTSLKEIKLPSSLTEIGPYAFDHAGLTSITLPSSLTTIGTAAFYYCEALEGLTIPASVTKIGIAAFAYCASLGAVKAESGDTELTLTAGTNTTTTSLGVFGRSGVTSVDFSGRNITEIPAYTFYYCEGLTSISFPSTLTSLGKYAFWFSGLTSVTLPGSVTTLAQYIFANCKALKSADLSALTVTSLYTEDTTKLTTSSYMFHTCSALEEVKLPATLTYLSGYTFTYCTSLKSVEIPDSVTYIGTYAFAYSGLTGSITLSSSVGLIGTNAFRGCTSLTKADLSNTALTSFYTTATGTTASHLFRDCTALTEVLLPSGLNILNGYAFYGCTALKSITIPDTVTNIGTYSFYGSGLTSITLPSSVTTIGTYVFANCYDLVKADLSATTITNLGSATTSYLFRNCTSLTEVLLPDTLTVLSGYAFYNCTALKSVAIPSSVTTIGTYAFAYSGITSVTLPSSVTSIGLYAFAYAYNLEKVDLSATTVTYLGTSATAASYLFYYCTSLSEVLLPSTLTTVNGYVFAYSGITNITLPSTVTTLGDYAFAYSNLATFEIPAGMTSSGFGMFVFMGCLNMSSITVNSANTEFIALNGILYTDGGMTLYFVLPSFTGAFVVSASVQKIASYAFAGSSVTSVSFENDDTAIESYAFYGCVELQSIALPANLTSIGASAFYGCELLTSVELPDGLTSIGAGAFMESGITSIVIPGSVTSIGKYAFALCVSLKTVTFEEGTSTLTLGAGSVTAGTLTTAGAEANFGPYFTATTNYGVFTYCTALESIDFSTRKLTTIPIATFYGCESLTTVLLPSTVVGFGSAAFAFCTSLETIEIPASFAYSTTSTQGINNGSTHQVFYGAVNFKAFTVNAANSDYTVVDGVLYADDGTTLVAYPTGKEGASFVVPDGVTSIKTYAFEMNEFTYLRSVTLPESMKTLGNYTFQYNAMLSEIILPSGLISIGNQAFRYCFNLTSVTLPSSLTSIGTQAFYYCQKLKEVYNLSSMTIGKNTSNGYVGYYVDSASYIYTSADTESMYTVIDNDFVTYTDGDDVVLASYKGAEKNVVIPEGITSISARAFYHDSSIETLVIADSVTTIATYAFSCMAALKEVTFGSGVTTIATYAFAYDIALERADLSAATSLEYFSTSATASSTYIFRACTALTEVLLPDSLTAINGYTFYGCTAIESLYIPASVTSIGSSAFYSVPLTAVYYGGTDWEEITINSTSNTALTDNDELTIYFYSETQPVTAGDYWHYVEGVITVW